MPRNAFCTNLWTPRGKSLQNLPSKHTMAIVHKCSVCSSWLSWGTLLWQKLLIYIRSIMIDTGTVTLPSPCRTRGPKQLSLILYLLLRTRATPTQSPHQSAVSVTLVVSNPSFWYPKAHYCPYFNSTTCGPHPDCVILEKREITVPCKNPKCPHTPTITVREPSPCPSCQTGCGTEIMIITTTTGCPTSTSKSTMTTPTPTATY